MKLPIRKETVAIVVHSTATPARMDRIDVDEIDMWHRAKGYRKVGYHFVIKRDGTIQTGRPFDAWGAHAGNLHNPNTVSICMVGGTTWEKEPKARKPENNFTAAQFHSLDSLITRLRVMFPKAAVCGHRDLEGARTDCPSFDVREWWQARTMPWGVDDNHD